MHRPPCRPARAASAITLALLLGVPLSACSGGDSEPDASGPNASAGTDVDAPAPLETVATVGKVVGKLSGPRRARLKAQVTEVVDGWIDAAYLGSYPRTDFADAFPGFSQGAVADARTDGALMSNKAWGADLDEVVALQRRLTIDVLAPSDRAAGVTARVVLTMRLSGEVNRKERVGGSLFMTYRDGAWQVFGYDVTRGSAR
ncbi:hypothetical protein NPS01_16010 [Nocardioides psychrotolerans]|uniref:Mce-associated membrane protein n=1 Tax=Nocardioides psychrotolerans TaxID=1005945 RepID=A0A1I3EYX2_9ACTN|nr:hypothetical protein [Nocardioides psychrotolerans]GEP37938.1 hypothetical protein NPS01_16010 [Nocardioides psychrotolerans]SFI04169.1 hypothetical protein SAMN05216561_104140 [Nocardioides psychrotolerans]